ncbi:MAG TPA: hypothetical protein VEW72_13445 [Burkholderiales bacterium]|nr:hypothetical protein [Burkholderiales bacterium]
MRGFSLLALFLAAVAAAQTTAAADDSAELLKLRAEITELIGPARCMNLVQCRIAGIGVNACGGPDGYVVYSWMSTDKAALETKIAEYNFLQEDLEKNRRSAGACVTPPEPVAACVNGRCILSGTRMNHAPG